MTRDSIWPFIAGVLVGVWLVMTIRPSLAHDHWISRGGLKNDAGEWCCGEGDCGNLDHDAVALISGGYAIDGFLTIEGTNQRIHIKEFVPQAEAQPSGNGHFVRCHRPDGSRRCFFAPPPGS